MPLYHIDGSHVLFVHIPKAGGTTVEFALSRYYTGLLDREFKGRFFPCSPQHFHRNILEVLFDLSKFHYSFAVVRHPMDRLKSEYLWKRRFFGVTDDFNVWATSALEAYLENSFAGDNHFRPMVEFLSPEIERFRLEDGIWRVFQRLKEMFPDAKIALDTPAAMKSGNNALILPSAELRSMVERIYRADFDMLNY